MRKLRTGVIGLGVGARHIACYEAHPDCDVTAICDLDPKKLREVGEQYPGRKMTERANEILTDPAIDVISIASYDDVHFEQICLGIEQGKHLMVEKPVCQSPEHMAEIRKRLAASPGIRFSSNHVLRVSSRFQELRRNIQAGEYGELYYLEGDYQYGRLHKIIDGWRGELDYYSVVQGGAVHMIDLLLWLTGEEPEEVTAFGNRISSRESGFRFDDMVAALIKMSSGAIAKVTANFGCRRPHFHGVEIHGTKKMFVNRPSEAEVFSSVEKGVPPDLMDIPYYDYQKPELIGSFLDWILGRAEPIVTPKDVFQTMATCFAVERAVQTGKPEKIENN